MQTAFTPDFYNNVAAIAVVLMFTKVVSHRTRKVDRTPNAIRWLARAHVLAVGAASAAVAISLAATDFKWTGVGIRVATWTALVMAGGLLIVDIVIDELPDLHTGTDAITDGSGH